MKEQRSQIEDCEASQTSETTGRYQELRGTERYGNVIGVQEQKPPDENWNHRGPINRSLNHESDVYGTNRTLRQSRRVIFWLLPLLGIWLCAHVSTDKPA